MTNLLVSIKKAVEPKRSDVSGSKSFKVRGVTLTPDGYKHKLLGDRESKTVLSAKKYPINSRVLVSGGVIEGLLGKTSTIYEV